MSLMTILLFQIDYLKSRWDVFSSNRNTLYEYNHISFLFLCAGISSPPATGRTLCKEYTVYTIHFVYTSMYYKQQLGKLIFVAEKLN